MRGVAPFCPGVIWQALVPLRPDVVEHPSEHVADPNTDEQSEPWVLGSLLANDVGAPSVGPLRSRIALTCCPRIPHALVVCVTGEFWGAIGDLANRLFGPI